MPRRRPTKQPNGAGERPRYNRRRARWEARLTLDGGEAGRRRTLVTGATEAECRARLDERRGVIASGLPLRTDTLADYLTKWCEGRLAASGQEPTTKATYRTMVHRHVVPHLGRVRLDELSTAHVDRWVATLGATGAGGPGGRGESRGASPSTIVKARSVLHMAIEDARRYGLVDRNPVADAVRPKVRPLTEPPALDEGELRALLAEVGDGWLGCAVRLHVATGLRPGELLGLTWAAIDLAEHRLRVVANLRNDGTLGPTKTPQSVRPVELDEGTVAMLRRHHAAQAERRFAAGTQWPARPGDMVNRLDDGRPVLVPTYRQALERAAARAGLGHVNPHDLRHTHASHLLAAGLATFEVARRLGDSERTIAAVYGHLVRPMRGGAEAIAAVLARAEPARTGEVAQLLR